MYIKFWFFIVSGAFLLIRSSSDEYDNDDESDEICDVCWFRVLAWLRHLGCEIERSAFRLDALHVVSERRRIDLDEHLLDVDDVATFVRFKRDHFAELCERLLPEDEYVYCQQRTKAHRREAMFFLLLDLARPRSLQVCRSRI